LLEPLREKGDSIVRVPLYLFPLEHNSRLSVADPKKVIGIGDKKKGHGWKKQGGALKAISMSQFVLAIPSVYKLQGTLRDVLW
jgi:hypothetical protein